MKTKRRRQKKVKRRTMKGGALSQQEKTQLAGYGFTEYQLDALNDMNITFNEILQPTLVSINMHYPDGFHGNPEDLEQIAEGVYDEIVNTPTQTANDDGTMDIAELEENSDDGRTTNATNSPNWSPNSSFGSIGGKRHRRKTNKKKTCRRCKKSMKRQRGGQCYGNGVGANPNNPNFSIYNTNALQLFPYKV